MGDSVKVAVRVRPFNNRERQEGAELCVDMRGNTTKVWNKEQGIEKEFNFDYSYWSHDGFTEDQTGVLRKSSPGSKYADQMTVFNDLGVEVLDNAWNGFHVCLFAYGQTGSGKSYSIVGYGANKGIIPITCEEIFSRIKQPQPKKVDFLVEVSMLEIYNEQVQDLLVPPAGREKGGLKVREDPKKGVYVEGIKKVTVTSYADISAWLDKGNEHRTVGATQMNATSSRAHTVLTISFTQVFYDESTGKPLNRKQSDINLVDLAGSERAGKTGATGDRLAEGSNINKSLSCLGKVITALAKKSTAAGKGEVVPYRESKLTRILQNALGGNSKTTMIAAISPATFNFEETLSTLRYADQVKAIKNKAVVNETPQEKLIRELKEENERLKALVEGKGGKVVSGVDDETLQEYQEQLERLRREKELAEMTFQQRLEDMERNKTHAVHKVEITGPHLSNLNEDPMLNGQIKHKLEEGEMIIGKGGNSQVIINGLKVGIEHCKLQTQGGRHYILPSGDPSCPTMVNGEIITSRRELNNQDRIRFGSHVYFSFNVPGAPMNSELDWEYAVKEANEAEVKSMMTEKESEMRKKEEELQLKMQEEIKRAYQKMEEEKKQLEALMHSKAKEDQATKSAIEQREKELIEKQHRMEQELKKKEQELKEKEKEKVQRGRMDQLISQTLQVANEANERAAILGKPIRFKPEFYRKMNEDGSMPKGAEAMKLRMRLMHPAIGDSKLFWPTEKLEERVPDMADLCEQYFTGTPLDKVDVGYDPFGINPDELDLMMEDGGYIGMVNIISDIFWNLLDFEEGDHSIISGSGEEVGKLQASVGFNITGEDMDALEFENMSEIVGKECVFGFNIKMAKGLNSNVSKDVFCSYSLPFLGREVFKTSQSSGSSPTFNYQKEHRFIVTRFVADEIEHGTLVINVFGKKSEALKMEEQERLRKALGNPNLSYSQKEEVKAGGKKPAQDSKSISHPEPAKKSDYNPEPAKKAESKPEPPKNQDYKSQPSPLSQSILDGSIDKKNQSTAAVVPAVVESANDARVKELEEKLKKAEAENSKKSGCCVVI